MTYEEYEKRRQKLAQEIEALRRRFIEANAPYKIGQKISIKDGNKRVEGKIVGFEIWIREVRPIVKRIKKDGTLSQNPLLIWSDSDMKLID